MAEETELYFPLKRVRYNGNEVDILSQNQNGPCPLLAIMNILLLKKLIVLPNPQVGVISCTELLALLSDRMCSRSSDTFSAPAERVNYEQNLSDCLSNFGQLASGLDVNPNFTKVTHFEFTAQNVIFDLLGINLYHGWIIPPSHGYASIIAKYSYNQALEKVVSMRSIQQNQLTRQEDLLLLQEGQILENWLFKESPSQLTFQGILELLSTLKEDELGIFFRNNHFNVICKNGGNLYLLVTDVGYLENPSIVWELLNEVSGDTQYVNSNFLLAEHTEDITVPQSSNQEELDMQLALQLHHEQVKKQERRAREARASNQADPYQDPGWLQYQQAQQEPHSQLPQYLQDPQHAHLSHAWQQHQQKQYQHHLHRQNQKQKTQERQRANSGSDEDFCVLF